MFLINSIFILISRCYQKLWNRFKIFDFISSWSCSLSNNLPVPVRNVIGTLLLLLNAKNGREIARVGIKDRRNATKRAVVADRGCATNLLVFELDTDEDDGSEDAEDGTMKNLSAVDKAPGLGNIVPEFDDAPDDS